MIPVRIQRKRSKGFNLQAESRKINGLDCVYVGRPSKWGNPNKVGDCNWLCKTAEMAAMWFRIMVSNINTPTGAKLYSNGQHFIYKNIQKELKGKNLACWCPDNQPCHADTLLKIANGKQA